MPENVSLQEADQQFLPRWREIGGLRLDLIARDGCVGGRALGLHPREFALIWRLADSPGMKVAKHTLIRDVWHMMHEPNTNSLAVHIFRLRKKLAIVGYGKLIRTVPTGGYLISMDGTADKVSPKQCSKINLECGIHRESGNCSLHPHVYSHDGSCGVGVFPKQSSNRSMDK